MTDLMHIYQDIQCLRNQLSSKFEVLPECGIPVVFRFPDNSRVELTIESNAPTKVERLYIFKLSVAS